jgi:predicted O-methyltransferase YrrM
MLNKIKTAVWFLKNPKYISQVFQVLKRRKNAALENTSRQATEWCERNFVPLNDALKMMLGDRNYGDLSISFPEEMKAAKIMADNTPVKMGGEGATSFIYHLVKYSGAKNIIETGVAYGWSSLAILLAIKDKEGARLISNDMPYINMGNDDYVGCVVPNQLKDKWELQRLPDVNGIPLALKKFNQQIDLCHYDSDKSYTGRTWASPILWKALGEGGYFVSDDINDNIAFKQFCESVNRTPVIIKHIDKYVGVIVK